MGYYDWEKIFKNKTDKELYSIYLGKSHLGEEARVNAKKELELRKFDFKNLKKHKKKWELEGLLEEERFEHKTYGHEYTKTKHMLLCFIGFGVFTLVFVLNLLFDFIDIPDRPENKITRYLFPILGFCITIFFYFSYRKSKNREKFREDRIKTIINEL